MNLKSVIIAVALLLPYSLEAQDTVSISWDYTDQTLNDFILTAEKELDKRFFFKEEWIEGVNYHGQAENNTINSVLDGFTENTSLYYFMDKRGNIIFTRDYVIKVSEQYSQADSNFIPPSEYDDSVIEDETSSDSYITIGSSSDSDLPGDVIVSGYILNRDTHDPVAGATVYVQDLTIGDLTNKYGFYSLSLPRGTHKFQYTFIGMKDRTVNLNIYDDGELNVEMNSVLIPLREAVVSAQRDVTLKRYEVGMEKINIEALKLAPTSLGEADIIKSVLMLTGVQSLGEGSSGFNVRGGSADQNLILLYGAPVYNSSHFFGFFSAVNSDIIKDVTLYKGGIPARYGGRISSVLDITTRDGNRNEFGGNAGISPVMAHLTVEGPLKKDTCFFLLSSRTTYSNWLLNLIDNPDLQKSRISFYDFNGSLAYEINKDNEINISSYLSHDAFRFRSDTVYSYNNSILALNWRHFFHSRFFSSISINNSHYKYEISGNENTTESFLLSHELNSTAAKADFNLFYNRHEINFGADLNRYEILPGSYLPSGDSSLISANILDKERAMEGGLYIDDKFTLTNYLSLNVGLRFSSFFAFGPQTEMKYDPEYPKSISTVTDTLVFNRGQVFTSYYGPEIRLSLNFRISNDNSFKINYNRTRQYLHLLSNTTSIAPSDTWKLSDLHLKPQIGDQYAVGFYRMLFNGKMESSVELYYKDIRNMIDFKGGTNLVMNENIEKDIVNAHGKAYGLELVLKKNTGRTRFSIGYTYARTFIKSIGTFSEELINSGEWFPANFDKPNDLVVSFNQIFSRRFSFSSSYTWSTGRPITYPVATYHLSDKLLIYYSERNKYRIPDYSRLDVSVKINGNLRSNKIAHPSWTFSVYNLLSRQNVYSVFFKYEDLKFENEAIMGYKLSVFGRAMPSVTFSFDF